ncbi:unnamed protein product [Oppiella nova]|uniref:SCP2 domain-containing protein n=1 Tax=Oppiella nova TaxID=334625 RepID=A0A7R9QD88_9ACAR|nr:unnamed protein product [Oppiella nova]CAG2162700.1 unnamed protein product [Oppiella nova]
MSSAQSIPQQMMTSDIDIDRSFETWVNTSLQRKPDLAQKINCVYQINIRQKPNSVSTWILDLSQGSGALYRQAKNEVKCSLTIDESDLIQAIMNKSHLHKLFFERKMSLKGTRVALEKLQQFWVETDKCNEDFKFISKGTHDKPINGNQWDLFDFTSNGFKSDIIFHTLKNRMHEEEDIVRKLTGIMQFDITKDETKSVWTIDFTKPLGQNVYRGTSPEKPVCILTMGDEDFAKMMVNKFNPQKAFMLGKMKVKGQILSIYKLFTVWVEAAFKKKKAPEVPYIENILFNSDLIPGLKSEIMVFRLIQRFVKCPQLCAEVGGFYYFDITIDGKVVSKWKLDFTENKVCGIFTRQPLDSQQTSQPLIVIEDEDFALISLNQLDIQKAMTSQRIKGDIKLAPKLVKIFQLPVIHSKL